MKDTPDPAARRPRGPRTHAVHGGTRRSQYGEVSEAIFMTQGFVYDSAEDAARRFETSGPDEFIYARYGNPTVAMFEERLAAICGAEDCFATASGMAAVNAALTAMLRAGDRVVSSRALFGSCSYVLEEVLARFGVDVAFVDGRDLDQWRTAVTPGTKAVFLESVSNPTLEVIDLPAVAEISHAAGALVLVDNVFATPVLSDPFGAGADVVIYSATKHIDGQGRALGGAILGTREFVRKTAEPYLKHTGGALSPFNAWIMLKGLETMDLRVRAQADTAARLAGALDEAGVPVIYPGLESHPDRAAARALMTGGGTVLSLDLGSQRAAFAFLNALEVAVISNNLGDAKTIATHPATTTHSRLTEEARHRLGIGPGLVRVSAGLEDPDDLVADIVGAVEVARVGAEASSAA